MIVQFILAYMYSLKVCSVIKKNEIQIEMEKDRYTCQSIPYITIYTYRNCNGNKTKKREKKETNCYIEYMHERARYKI